MNMAARIIAEYTSGMEDAFFGFLGVAFASFCIWLAVRIVNRREAWAIRTAVSIAESLAIFGSAYSFIFYSWLTATPLPPARLGNAQLRAYLSLCAFAASCCLALLTVAIFIWKRRKL
jgi:hypothetical protein